MLRSMPEMDVSSLFALDTACKVETTAGHAQGWLCKTCHDVMLSSTERSRTFVSSVTQSIAPSKAATPF